MAAGGQIRKSKSFLLNTTQDADARKRYPDKLSIIGGLDPYEIQRIEWQDDVDLWQSVTHITWDKI